jgi:uncharacterized LabA/DUF88 family protein
MARSRGFEPIVYDRNSRDREKGVDDSISTEMMADSYERMKADSDEITLVAGDADYVPTIENVRKRGFVVNVMFWDHAARDLRDAATKSFPMNPHLGFLALDR